MLRRIIILVAALSLMSSLATAEELLKESPDAADTGLVRLKGLLSVFSTLKEGAEENSRPQDDENWKLAGASIQVGGRCIELDWSRSERIRDELFWWRVPRHGDFRLVQADVTGHLKFIPVAEFQKDHTVIRTVVDSETVDTDPAAGTSVEPAIVISPVFDIDSIESELPPTPPGKIAVLVIESLNVELVGPDGQVRGTQPPRPRVTAERK